MPDIHTYESRLRQMPGFDALKWESWREKSLLVVGLGGLGSPFVMALAGMGWGKVTLLDGDTVHFSNLSRQVLYNSTDVGQSKATLAASEMQSRNPFVEWKAINEWLHPSNALDLVKEHDLIVDCTDNFDTRYLINDACYLANKPFVFGSVFRDEGTFALLNHQNGPTLRCLYPEPPQFETSCTIEGVWPLICQLTGTYMAQVVWDWAWNEGKTFSKKYVLVGLNQPGEISLALEKGDSSAFPKAIVPENYPSICNPRNSNGQGENPHEIPWEMLEKWEKEGISTRVFDIRSSFEYKTRPSRFEWIPEEEIETIVLETTRIGESVVLVCNQGVQSLKWVVQIKRKYPEVEVYSLKGGIEVS